jgi:hypothetical protein
MTRPSGNSVPLVDTIRIFFSSTGIHFCTGPARKFTYKLTFTDFKLSRIINSSSVLGLLHCVDVGDVASFWKHMRPPSSWCNCVWRFSEFLYIYIYIYIYIRAQKSVNCSVKCTLKYVRNFFFIYWFFFNEIPDVQVHNSQRSDTVLQIDWQVWFWTSPLIRKNALP